MPTTANETRLDNAKNKVPQKFSKRISIDEADNGFIVSLTIEDVNNYSTKQRRKEVAKTEADVKKIVSSFL